jgi:hypothetical protein
MFSGISIPGERQTFSLEAVVVLVGAIAVAGCILVPEAGLLVVIGCTAMWFIAMVGEVVRGRIDGILLSWAAFYPLGSFAMFPRDHAIVTLDRVVILLALIGLFFVKPGTLIAIPRALRQAGLACLAFIAVAGVSLAKSLEPLGPARQLLDYLMLPLLLSWFVIAWFDVRRRLSTIHTAVCITSTFSAIVAGAEIVTKVDLLPIAGSAMFFAGSTARPNGPFATNDQLALVGALNVFFLLFLRAALGPRISAGRRVLHSIGLAGAIGMALMPMFRSVAIALLVALIIDTFWEKRTIRRGWRVALIVAFVGLIFIVKAFEPDVFEDRSSMDNFYARIAQLKQNFWVFADHPILGVGFSNFNSFVVGEARYRASYSGVPSVDWSHNNLATALTETGIVGFVPYVMTHLLLFRAIRQLHRLSSSGRLAWKYLFYVFLTYWTTGLTLSSGFEYPNVWYAFVIAICYKYGTTAPDLMQPAEVGGSDEAFSVLPESFRPRFSDEGTI